MVSIIGLGRLPLYLACSAVNAPYGLVGVGDIYIAACALLVLLNGVYVVGVYLIENRAVFIGDTAGRACIMEIGACFVKAYVEICCQLIGAAC